MNSIAIEKEFDLDNLKLIETKAPYFGPHDVLNYLNQILFLLLWNSFLYQFLGIVNWLYGSHESATTILTWCLIGKLQELAM
jgi:hypothetical protein